MYCTTKAMLGVSYLRWFFKPTTKKYTWNQSLNSITRKVARYLTYPVSSVEAHFLATRDLGKLGDLQEIHPNLRILQVKAGEE
jgi:hypothetical protein